MTKVEKLTERRKATVPLAKVMEKALFALDTSRHFATVRTLRAEWNRAILKIERM